MSGIIAGLSGVAIGLGGSANAGSMEPARETGKNDMAMMDG